ncbi:helix-turn-helix domain-containing protein [Pseudomonas solani]|uniref:helix-turn-helix domain-containing protein n=1 Tax=Pseudomonas solani TaxID=2731552 RepID=UPI003D6AF9FA
MARWTLSALRACRLAPEARKRLRHAWPGNVRELARVLPELREGLTQPAPQKQRPRTKEDLHTIGKTAQLQHIQETLESCQGNLDEAARRLGISRTTLWRRLRLAD